MNEENLIKYYNKFNEDKRLNTMHGKVEYLTAMKYIHKYIKSGDKILDIGAGTGKYSITLYNEGYDVTSVELVKHNLRVLQKNEPNIKAYQGNALNLKFEDNSFDIVLLFGPMYHLIKFEDKLKALEEAKRVCKPNGLIFISYCMNEYAIITHGLIDNIFNKYKNLQRKVFESMFRKGLYELESVEETKINNKLKTLNQDLESLDN